MEVEVGREEVEGKEMNAMEPEPTAPLRCGIPAYDRHLSLN